MPTKMRFPKPEQYGMSSVPSAVPSSPWSSIASSRHTMSSDTPRNTAR